MIFDAKWTIELIERAKHHASKCLVVRDDAPDRLVKNLAWLLRKWRLVHSFELYRVASPNYESVLIAKLHSGNFETLVGAFVTVYASEWVCLTLFLDRPVFRGLSVRTLDGNEYEIGSPEYHAAIAAHAHTPRASIDLPAAHSED